MRGSLAPRQGPRDAGVVLGAMAMDPDAEPAYHSLVSLMIEATALPDGGAGVKRRPVVAGSVSLGAHGGLLLLIFAVAGGRSAIESQVAEPTPIEIVTPPPPLSPPSNGPGAQLRSATHTRVGTLGRHGHDAPPPSPSHAPATADPFADLVTSYETPTGPDPGNEAGTTGLGLGWGLAGVGTGGGGGFEQFGLGNVPPPPPPPPSLARPPRPKADYRSWDFRAAGRFAGAIVRVELSIDPSGSVRAVRILQGVDETFDKRATEIARHFAFYPALDAAGSPTWGRHRWEFVIQAAADRAFQFQPRL